MAKDDKVKDIAPELLEKIRKEFEEEYKKSSEIKRITKTLNLKTATYKEANEYAIEVGKILSNAYKHNLSSDVLPNGKMYYNIAKRVLEPTMEDTGGIIWNIAKKVQETLNEEANIGIKAQPPPSQKNKIKGIVDRISSEEKYDDVSWILIEPVKTYAQSIIDDTIKANADFQYKSGLSPKIVRTVAGSCCAWCQAVAGSYEYPDVPKDVYRRHQRCRCMVNFHPGNGKVQNVHDKSFRNETKIEKRKLIGLESQQELKATRFKRTFDAVSEKEIVEVMEKESEKWINTLSEEEIRCIRKYSFNEPNTRPRFYERLNSMLRGEIPPEDNLNYYAEVISNALKKNITQQNMICYRGIDFNPFSNYKVGDFISLNQFTSTSVKSSGAFKKNVRMVIYVKKNSKGVAYIGNISKFPKQREALFDKDCIYRVLSNSKELVELEVI